MPRVLTAERYRYGALSSTGDARYMLLRQHNFPDTYSQENGDRLLSADHDRLLTWDRAAFYAAMKEHTGHEGEMYLQTFARDAAPEKILALVKAIFGVDAATNWTGFRILGTVNRSNGYPVFSLELFAKGEQSPTPVYSGADAPNVQGHELTYGRPGWPTEFHEPARRPFEGKP